MEGDVIFYHLNLDVKTIFIVYNTDNIYQLLYKITLCKMYWNNAGYKFST
jgi:hypothetical protein